MDHPVARLILLTLLVWVAALLQGSVVAPLLGPGRPDLPLMVALAGAWLTDSVGGGWLGLWAGLLTAVLNGGLFVGSYTFCNLVAGWCTGRAREAFYADWPLFVPPVVAAGALLAETLFFLWSPRHALPPLSMVTSAAVDGLLAPLVVLPIARLFRRRRP